MSKKVRILALALVVAVALVGAGYAAWGTTITSTTKMQTGEWKIVLENDSNASYWAADQIDYFTRDGILTGGITGNDWDDLEGIYGDYNRSTDQVNRMAGGDYVYVMAPVPTDLGYGVPESAIDNYTACTFQFYNLHPGTRAFTRFEIRNDGSIPAQIADVRVKILDINGNPIDAGDSSINQVINAMIVNPVFGIHNGSGTSENDLISGTSTGLSGLEAVLDAALIGHTLDCDNKLFSYSVSSNVSDELETGPDSGLENSFNFELPASALDGNIGMNAEFQIVIELDFVQYNQVLD